MKKEELYDAVGGMDENMLAQALQVARFTTVLSDPIMEAAVVAVLSIRRCMIAQFLIMIL